MILYTILYTTSMIFSLSLTGNGEIVLKMLNLIAVFQVLGLTIVLLLLKLDLALERLQRNKRESSTIGKF